MGTLISNDRVEPNSSGYEVSEEELLCKIYSLAAFIANENADMIEGNLLKEIHEKH